jgi:hypothetical protein
MYHAAICNLRNFILSMPTDKAAAKYLDVEMAGILVIVPHVRVVAVRQTISRHPVTSAAVTSTLRHETCHEGGGSDVEL